MNLLKKENWFVNVLLWFISQGLYVFILAYFMKIYRKEAWYMDYRYWLVGILFCFFPTLIMLYIFMIQMTVEVAAALEVPGCNIYRTPYSWILCCIVPIIGWILLIVMMVYIQIWILVKLYQGKGEQFLNV